MSTDFVSRAPRSVFGLASLAFAVTVLGSCVSSPGAVRGEPSDGVAETVSAWKVSSIESLYPDGAVSGRVAFVYDTDGTLLSEETFGPGGALRSRKAYSRTADGEEVIVSLGPTGDVVGKAVRRYVGGTLVGETLLGAAGAEQSTEQYTLDERGRRIARSVVTASGFGTSSEYVYDGEVAVRTIVRDSAGKVLRRFEITAEGGLPVREDEYDGAGNRVSSIVRRYASALLLREERLDASLSTVSSREFDRDAHGNVVEIRYRDGNGNLLETERTKWVRFGNVPGSPGAPDAIAGNAAIADNAANAR